MSSVLVTPINVAVVGLGATGRAVAAAVAADAGFRLAGLVDLDPKNTGRRLIELGVASNSPVVVTDDVDQLDAVDVAVVCAGPRLDRIAPTFRHLMRKHTHVVASCAEMTWPWLKHPHLGDVLGGEARRAGVAILGAGVYPAFGFDRTPLAMAATTTGVRKVTARRVIDLNHCPAAVRRRCGLGKTVAQFAALAKQQIVGQPGLGESVVLIAQGLGRHPTTSQIGRTVLPLLAEDSIDTAGGRIEAGHVGGVRQRAVYQEDDFEVVFELTTTHAAASDEVEIESDAPVRRARPGAAASDATTALVLLDAARRVIALPAGLRTVLDLPMPPVETE